MEKALKVSVIGTGHLGSIHARLWAGEMNSTLIGIYDLDAERAKEIAAENNCKNFSTLDECIAESDAVTIAAPTSLHYEIACKCIENNTHCFIEKPITTTYEEAQDLILKAKEKNVMVQVGHVERFNPALSAIKNYELDPMFIEAHRLAQFKPRATDVSVILDLMIHDIDIMLWLVNSKVKHIDANGVAVLTETPDICNARITFENGAVANLTASRISARPMRKMRLFQNNAYISLDFGNSDVEVYRIMDGANQSDMVPATMLGTIEAGTQDKMIGFEKPVVPQINAIAEEQKAFAEAIINNSPIAVTAEEAANALKIAEEIAELIK